MKRSFLIAASAFAMFAGNTAFAADTYNPVPASDPQYRQCLSFAAKLYEGGNDKSPIAGQTKAQAWCTCMWNETPDDFKGNLATFAESPRGKSTNKICEKYSDWSE